MKINKVLLVHSSHYHENGKVVRADRLIDRFTVTNVVHMALPLLASYLPSHINCELIEDCFEEIPYEDKAEVVFISAQVMQITRSIDIADEFRKRGKIVIMGGYLPSMHPELVEDHVDALCLGEADLIIHDILSDIENDSLKKRYEGQILRDFSKQPIPRYDLIKKDRMVIYPIQATRGCPFKCDYCSIIQINQMTYRQRPVEDIIRDIKATKSKFIYFVDDNLMEDPRFCKRLFKEMIPLKVIWGTQTTINCHSDPELLDLAYKSGCRFLAIGLESLSQENLQSVSKGFNQVSQMEKQIENIHRSGIAVHALIIFGLDNDTPDTFQNTLHYLNRLNIAIAEFFTCTPYPGTPMGKKYVMAGRIIEQDLAKYREGHIVFKHPTMTEEEILSLYWKTLRSFYSLHSIFKRILKGTFKNKLYHLVNALSYWIKIKRNIIPVYFGEGNKRIST